MGSELAISIESLSKCYHLGPIGAHTLKENIRLKWHRMRGHNPQEKMGVIDLQANHDGIKHHEPDSGLSSSVSDEIWALRDISLEVAEGEVLGIIGKNGAGKSTLLKILARVTRPTSGRAVLRGSMASMLEIGMGFHPDLSGRDNIYLNGAVMGMKSKEIDRKFDQIVEFSELARFIETPVKRYSNGMYVRLAFAVAVHQDPDILLIDEVLAVGDNDFKMKCLQKMQSIVEGGKTILFVSHDMSIIQQLCNQCILLKSGRLEAVGETSGIVNQYLAG